MKPGGSRRKGHSFERWFAKWLREKYEMFGLEAKRGWQARGGGKEEDDVEVTINGEKPPLHFECNHSKAPSVWAKYKQAEDDCDDHEMPIVIVKRDRDKPMVFLSLEDFDQFFLAWIEGHEWGGDDD